MRRLLGTAVVLCSLSLPMVVRAEPSAPTGLTATYNGTDTVTLNWNDTPGATEYWIFRNVVNSAVDGLNDRPMTYDKYAYQYAYGYYSKFATLLRA